MKVLLECAGTVCHYYCPRRNFKIPFPYWKAIPRVEFPLHRQHYAYSGGIILMWRGWGIQLSPLERFCAILCRFVILHHVHRNSIRLFLPTSVPIKTSLNIFTTIKQLCYIKLPFYCCIKKYHWKTHLIKVLLTGSFSIGIQCGRSLPLFLELFWLRRGSDTKSRSFDALDPMRYTQRSLLSWFSGRGQRKNIS